MKLATYLHAGAQRIGLVEPDADRIIDLAASAAGSGRQAPFGTMLELIEAGDAGLDLARDIAAWAGRDAFAIPLRDARLRAPIPLPPQIRDFSVFPEHIVMAPIGGRRLVRRLAGEPEVDERPGQVPEVYRRLPIYYISNRFAVGHPEDDVHWPSYSQIMDYELEFAAVIGRGGRDIGRSEAPAHIFGYMIYNDFSARDAQMREMPGMLGPAKGKSFDGSNVFGPWIATADEFPNGHAFTLEVRVNGETRARGSSAQMLHGFDDMIAHASAGETLHPGEIFGSGTVGGGCGLETGRFLDDGDVVELEVSGLGVLRNRVRLADATKRSPSPGIVR